MRWLVETLERLSIRASGLFSFFNLWHLVAAVGPHPEKYWALKVGQQKTGTNLKQVSGAVVYLEWTFCPPLQTKNHPPPFEIWADLAGQPSYSSKTSG